MKSKRRQNRPILTHTEVLEAHAEDKISPFPLLVYLHLLRISRFEQQDASLVDTLTEEVNEPAPKVKDAVQALSQRGWITTLNLGNDRSTRVSLKGPTGEQDDSSFEADGHIYLAYCDTGHYKIGYSSYPDARVTHFDTQMPVEVSRVHTFPTDDATGTESKLHRECADWHHKGEWFTLPDRIVNAIQKIQRAQDAAYYDQDNQPAIKLQDLIEGQHNVYQADDQSMGERPRGPHRNDGPSRTGRPRQ